MPDSQWRNFALVLRRVLRQPLAIGVLSLGSLWSLVTLHPSGVLVALVVVVVYAGIKLQDESFIREAIREAMGRRRRSDMMSRTFRIEELDVDSRVKMKTIVKLQSEIAEEVTNSPVDEVAVGLADTVDQTEQIADRGLAVAQKRRELQRYLTRTDPGAIEARIRSIEARLAEETDQVRRSELQISLAAKQRELDDYHAIHEASARILDQLDSIECAFSGLRARLVRIKSTDIAEWAAANTELQAQLGSLSSAADVLEQSIEEALSIGNTGG